MGATRSRNAGRRPWSRRRPTGSSRRAWTCPPRWPRPRRRPPPAAATRRDPSTVCSSLCRAAPGSLDAPRLLARSPRQVAATLLEELLGEALLELAALFAGLHERR